MSHRRQCLTLLAIDAMVSALRLSQKTLAAATVGGTSAGTGKKAIVVSTWKHGMPANAAAWQVLRSGDTAPSALNQVQFDLQFAESQPSFRIGQLELLP